MRKELSLLFVFVFLIFGIGMVSYSAEQVRWVHQHSGPESDPQTIIMREEFAEKVKAMSDGQFIIEINSGGAIVPALGELDATDKGVLDMCTFDPGQEKARVPSAGLFTGRPGGMDSAGILQWLESGGMDLAREAFKSYNVLILDMLTYHNPEVWAHSTFKINSLEDLVGKKMRCKGDAGEILATMGISPVLLAGGEVYEALQRGVIDLAEVSGLAKDWLLALHEVTRYQYMSRGRAPAEGGFVAVNNKSYNALPENFKAILKVAVADLCNSFDTQMAIADVEALRKWKDYGCEFYKIPADVDSELSKKAREFYEKKAEEAGPLYEEILESQASFQKEYEELQQLFIPESGS
jgi:TRAP-type mannitol/chloroaromatic compound transport system substrate-binding protein